MDGLPLIFSAFLLGLTGGFAHCTGMCSPFVLYVSSKFSAVGYGLLIPQLKYNLGRISTYIFLGVLVGFLGNLGIINDYLVIQKTVTVAAGFFLILFAFANALKFHPKIPLLSRLAKLPAVNSAYLTGVALGFLPCGLVLGALITAALSTGPLTGGLAMAVFGLGTSVALLLTALFGGLLLKYIPVAKYIFSAILIVSGIYFIYTALRLS